MGKNNNEKNESIKSLKGNSNKTAMIIIVIVLIAIIGGSIIAFTAMNAPEYNEEQIQQIKDKKEALKEAYSQGDIDLDDNDFEIITNDENEVVVQVSNNDKKNKFDNATTNAMKNLYLNHGFDESELIIDENGNITVDPSNPNHEITDPTNPSAIPSKENIKNNISLELAGMKGYMDRTLSTDNLYSEPVKKMLENVRAGNLNDSYDNHKDITDGSAFGSLCACSYMFGALKPEDTQSCFDNRYIYNMSGNICSNIILNELYNQEIGDVELVSVYTDQSFNLNGKTMNSSYMIYTTNGTKILTDFGFNILDIV